MQASLWILVGLLFCATAVKEKKVVCYLNSQAAYRTGNDHFDPTNIDPRLCTHVTYLGVRLGPGGTIRINDPTTDLPENGGKDGFNLTNQLRKKNPCLKTLIKLQYVTEDLDMYDQMVATPNSRKVFASNAVNFLKKYDFNGLDFDWDFYRISGVNTATKNQNFALLLKELRETFDRENFLLSTQVFGHVNAYTSYSIVDFVKYPHFINLLAGYHYYSMEGVTNNNAPLYAGSWEQGEGLRLNLASSAYYWLSQGAPAEKLVVGVPFFGSTYTLADTSNTGLGAPATGNNFQSLTYYEVCRKLLVEQWSTRFNEEQKIPYAFKSNEWMGFETPRSVREKAKFVNKLELGGVMVWSVDRDDFRGTCGTTYPLLTALHEELHKTHSPSEDTCFKNYECTYEQCECRGSIKSRLLSEDTCFKKYEHSYKQC